VVGKLLGEVVTDMFGVGLVGGLDEVVRDEVELVEGLDEVVRESFELELVGENKMGNKMYQRFWLRKYGLKKFRYRNLNLVVGILKVLKVFMVNLTHITVKIAPNRA